MNPKQIDHRKLVGQLGINLIERIVLRMGYVWHPSNSELDAGIDGVVEIRDPATGEATNFILQIQSKSLSTFTAETERQFEYVCDKRDLDYWLAGNAPVILVVSRSRSDEAYWVPVKGYFSDAERRKSRRIVFNKETQRFDDKCAAAFRDLAVPRDAGPYIGSAPRTETLVSNLLRVTRFPPTIYVAETRFRFPGQVWSQARSVGLHLSGEWILRSGTIISIHDLRIQPWASICEPDKVVAEDCERWAWSDDRDRQNAFVQILHQCLCERLWPLDIAYHRKREVFYFKATPKLTSRQVNYPSLKNLTDKMVFAPYESKTVRGRVAYYRHSAFDGVFRRANDAWYLQVTPTYYFSSDGYSESRYAAERLSGIKRLERNRAVLGQLLMWTECLTSDANLFRFAYPFLTFSAPERFEIGAGLDDAAWLGREEDEPRAAAMRADIQEARLFEL